MSKLWQGRSSGNINENADLLNKSIDFDKRLYSYDINGSIAHVKMLSYCGIIKKEEESILTANLKNLLDDINNKRKEITSTSEDIHSFVEFEMIKRVGDVAKKIHTARSRNDQVALDIRLYLKDICKTFKTNIINLLSTLCNIAEKNLDAVMPGFTHLQHAQPILFSHYIMCYSAMFERDFERFDFALKQTDESPIGACALAGTGFNIDRFYEASLLSFSKVSRNSIDSVSNRDFALDFLYASSVLSMHLSRLCEELIIYSSAPYSYIEFSDDFSTGSSIMPQKKNPDIAELIRGKTGRVYSSLFSLLTTLKGLPLAYNKDMQEDKEGVFDTADTLLKIFNVLPDMLSSIKVNKDKMRSSCENGYINATDVADYLTLKGIPFRQAYSIVGSIVQYAVQKEKKLSELTIEEFKSFSSYFEKDIYSFIDISECVDKRKSYGGTSKNCVELQIKELKERLVKLKEY